ncbi:MAG: TAXI family TRAP transporter solute-binding subunit [Burkholderiaceae bacterium]
MVFIKPSILSTSIASIALAVSASSAFAADVDLPKNISWTAYGTTSSGYAQSVGLGQMLSKNYGTSLRIIPGKNDVSRMVPLRSGQSKICACGFAALFSQEGSLMFGTKQWGPMRIYNLFNNLGTNGQQLVVAADAGIKTAADLKGKRVTWVKGAPALNMNASASLAFAGLTWDDVIKVEVPGWGQGVEAVINGQADATHGSTVSSAFNQLAASPRGLYWITFPHANKEGWARAKAAAPVWNETMIESAVAVENNEQGKVPYEGNNYPYPLFVAMNDTPDNLAYGLTKAVMENYDQIKDSGPGMNGYQLSRQPIKYVFPFHPASIKYYKEKGVWTAEHDKHNAMLMKRQDVLAAAWAKMDQSLADDAFSTAWQRVRAAALEEAGLEVSFRTWE